MLVNLILDLRTAGRALLRSPVFSGTVVLTLGASTAAAAAAFALVNGVLLRPLPYEDSERLVEVWFKSPLTSLDRFRQSPGTYLHLTNEARYFESFGIARPVATTVGVGDEYERVSSLGVTASMFDVLTARVAIGRPLSDRDQLPSAQPVVVVSDEYWRSRLGGEPSVLGQTIRVDGVDREVVGVFERGFAFPEPGTNLWIPLAIDPAAPELASFIYVGYAKLRPDVDEAALTSDFERMVNLLPEVYPQAFPRALLERAQLSGLIIPLRESVVGDSGLILWAVLGAAFVILAMSVANVANLFLVRADHRTQERAVRVAMGASSGRMLGHAFSETGLLLAVSAAAGIGGAALLMVWMRGPLAGSVPRLHEIGMGVLEISLVFGISILVATLLVFLPGSSGHSTRLTEVLRDGARAIGPGSAAARLRRILLVGQVSLSLILITGAGVLVRSFANLTRVDTGFVSDDVLGARLYLPPSDYPDAPSVARAYDRIVESVSAIPGVTSVGAVTHLPLRDRRVFLPLRAEDDLDSEEQLPETVLTKAVTGDYFDALGINLLEGRLLDRSDRENQTDAIVVSDVLAANLWPDVSALGKRIRLFSGGQFSGRPYQVVGVVRAVRDRVISDPPVEMMYTPQTEEWASEGIDIREMSLAVKTSGDVRIIDAVRAAVSTVDSRLPVFAVQSMEQVEADAVSSVRFTAQIMAAAALLSLVLGAVGLYGVLSFLVSRRTREVGVRMALGADAGSVRWMVVRQALAMTIVGLVVGVAGATLAVRLIDGLVFGVSAFDPVSAVAAAVVLVIVSAVAAAIPAYRASTIDPCVALRAE